MARQSTALQSLHLLLTNEHGWHLGGAACDLGSAVPCAQCSQPLGDSGPCHIQYTAVTAPTEVAVAAPRSSKDCMFVHAYSLPLRELLTSSPPAPFETWITARDPGLLSLRRVGLHSCCLPHRRTGMSNREAARHTAPRARTPAGPRPLQPLQLRTPRSSTGDVRQDSGHSPFNQLYADILSCC